MSRSIARFAVLLIAALAAAAPLAAQTADVRISSMTDSPDPGTLGVNDITYSINVHNQGPNTANNVVLTNNLPASSSYVSSSANAGGSCVYLGGGVVSCSWTSMTNGSVFSATITTTPTAGGTLTNSASVTANETDPTPANNSASTTTTINSTIDLGITSHSDSPDPATLGLNNVSYFVNLGNLSTSSATGIVLTDTIPAASTYVSATPNAGGSCNESAGVVTCNWATMSAGSVFSVTIVVTPTAGGTLTNTATVSGAQPDGNSANNTSTHSTTVNANIDLGITSHSDSPDPATLGVNNVSYFVNLGNLSTSSASGIVLTDTIPAASTFVSATPNAGGSCNESAGVVTCNWASMSAGSVFSVTIVVTPTAGGTLTNSASVSGAQPDSNSANNSSTHSTTINSTIDLAVTSHSDSPDPATLGLNNVSYFVNIGNLSTSGATGIVLTDTIPAASTFVSATPNAGGSCNESAGVVTCNWASMSAGSVFSVTIVVTPTAGGTLTNSASVSGAQPDSNSANNSSTHSTTINATIDLAVTSHSDSPDPATLGLNNVSYFVNIGNLSTSGASGIVLTDTIPASSTFVSATPNAGGSCNESAGVVTCNWASMSAGSVFSVTIVVTPTAGGTITNSASVSGAQPDGNGANNSSTHSTTINATIDLAVTSHSDSPDPATLGLNNVSYFVNIGNLSTSGASGIVLTDTIPPASTYVSATPNAGGSCNESAGVVTCNWASMSAGSVFSVTIVVTPTAGGTITNTASVSGAQPDGNSANNSSTHSTTINATIDLAVTSHSDSPDPRQLGAGNVSYFVNIGNLSTSGASGIVLTDTIPPGTIYVSATPNAGGSCSQSAGVVTCNWASMSAGSVFSTTIVVTPTANGVITNTASVDGAQPDGNNANDSSTHSTTITPNAAPIITGFTPGSGAAGTLVTISGSNFTGATAVKFNGTSSTFNVVNDGTVTATVPGGATTGTIAVTNGIGTTNSAGTYFVDNFVHWINTSGGNWSTPANWSSGSVPSSGDIAAIDVAGTYSVTLDTNATVAGLNLGAASGSQTLANALFNLTLNGASSVAATGTLNTAGTLSGTGTLTVAGTVNWSAGSVTGTGGLTISSGGFLNITGVAAKSFSQRTINNSGTTNWTGSGQINSGLGAVFNNLSGGTLNIQTDAALHYNLGGTQTVLTNSANVVKSVTTGINDIAWTVNNNGTVSIQTGSIKLAGGGSGTGTYNVSSGAALKFFTGTYTFGSTASFTGAGTLDILSGTVTHAGTYTLTGPLNIAATFDLNNTVAVTLTDVTLSSGSLGGTGNYSSAGTFNWTGGSITGNGTLTINNGSALNISGASSKTFSNRTIVNNGTTTWSGAGNINSGLGAVFTNSAGKTFAIQNDATIFYNLGGVQAVFNNSGNVVKSVATGVTTLTCTFNNNSLLDVQSGSVRLSGGGTSSGLYAAASGATLRFNAGTHTLTGTPAINGAGAIDFEAGTINVNGTYALTGAPTVSGGAVTLTNISAFGSPLTVSNGSIAFNQAPALALTDVDFSGGTIGGTGPLTVSGTFGWNGGTIGGTGTLGINGGAAFNIGSASSKSFSQKTINNSGTATWSSGNINSGLGSVFNNLAGATFSIQTNSSAFYNLGGTQTVFNNSGSVVKSSSSGTSTIDWVFNNNNSLDVQSGTFRPTAGGTSSGTYTAGSGATMQFAGGTHTLSGTSGMTGAGTFDFISGTVTTSGTYTVTGPTNIAGATLNLNNASPVTLAAVNLSSGVLGGSGNWSLAGTFAWTGGTLTGGGALAVNSGANLNLSGVSAKTLSQRTINNSGTTTWSGTGGINSGLGAVFNNLAGATFDIQNDASFSYNLGGTQTVINNSTSMIKSAGSGLTTVDAVLNNNGTLDVQSGTLKATGGGTSSGDYTVASGATLRLGGGTHNLSASSDITGAGTVDFQAGTVSSAGTCTIFQINITGATLQLNNASPLSLSNVTFSSGTLTGSGDWSLTSLFLWSGGTITGAGTLSIDFGAVLDIIGASAKTLSQRTIDNAGTTAWLGTGTINSGLGAIFNNQPGGTFLIQNDATFAWNMGGVQTVFNNNGTLSKSSATGTSAWSIALNNQGLIEVSSGIFNPTSTFAQSSTASLRVDIAGLAAGTQYGRLAVTGAAPLDGTLIVNLIGGFTPTIGDTFQIVTFASHTGDFATKNGLLYPGGSFAYALNPTNVTLTAGAAVTTLTVDSINDSGAGSLRQAIDDANAGNCASPCTIAFNIGVTPHIGLLSELPIITAANLTIDGRTQPGYIGTPLVMLYGTGCTCVGPVFDVQGLGTTIAGLSIVDFPVAAMALGGGNASIIGNSIGVKTDGVTAGPVGDPAIEISSAGNTIGGLTVAERNVISGNSGSGITITTAAATNNQIKGNLIGLNLAGSPMGNGLDGIQILGGATLNTIGGPTAPERNVISGNTNSGVYINETVIVGSSFGPPSILTSSSSNNVIQGNYIGTDVTGTVAIGNANGIYISGAANDNVIGGGSAGMGNIISGNTQYGIALLGDATGTIIEGNKIGIDIYGASLGNDIGISMQAGAQKTKIGGTAAGEANVIAFNVTEGIKVASGSSGNEILGNSIYDNGNLGIDLNENGIHDSNDAGDGDGGGNGRQNFPSITSAVLSGGTLTLAFNLDSSATATTRVRVEFFEATATGQGETFLGAACIDGNNFGSGTSFPAGGIVLGDKIVATATSYSGSCASPGAATDGTSEFSLPFTVTCPAVVVGITPSGPTSFCPGGSVTLTATAGFPNYSWSTGATTQSILVNSSGTYTVTATNADGCSGMAQQVVTLNPNPPTPAITPSGPTALCTGGTVTLSAPAGYPGYLWSNGALTQSIVVNAAGSFSVTVTDANGCSAASAPTTVTVNPNPTATITPSGPTTFCAGGNVTLTATAGMTGYSWSNGATTPSINVTASGSFTVTVTDANGCSATSAPATVTVNPNPVATITPSGPTNFCTGGSVTLTAPGGMTTYAWSNGANTQSIIVNASGSFSVTVTNPQGCSATSGTVPVTVTPAPAATITPSGPTTFCAGGNVTLTAPAGMTSYAWSNGDTTQSINTTSSGSFTVTVTNAGGCSATSAATNVTVNPLPSVNVTPSGSTTFCTGGSVTLTATGGFANYAWSNGATTQAITVNASGNFSVTVTDANGCTATSAAIPVTVSSTSGVATISAPGTVNAGSTGHIASVAAGPSGTTYAWSISGGTITGGDGTPSITFNAGNSGAITLGVTVVSGACTSSGTATVSINSLADLKVVMTGSPNPVNGGGTITFTINVSNLGPNAGQNVGVVSNLFGATFVGAAGAGWTCNGGGSPVNCTMPTLPVGNAAPLVVTAQAGNGPGTATLDVILVASSSDPNLNDDSASATVVIGAPQPTCSNIVPAITAPAAGAINSPATIVWTGSPNAVGYDLWLSINNAAPSIIASTSSTSATVALPSGPLGIFIGARFANCPALFSAARSYTVAASPNCNNSKAQLSSPMGGVVASPVTFNWQAAPQAIGYRLWVEIDGGGPQDIATTNGPLTATVALNGHSVKWSVESLFPGCGSTLSDPATFQLAAVNACADHQQASLVAPANNANALSSEVKFDWNSVPDADGYRVWAAVDGAPFVVVGITTNATELDAVIAHGSVEWFVETEFNGCPSTESAHRFLSVPAAQSCNHNAPATNLAPSNVIIPNGSIDFTWSPAPNAIAYEVWIGLQGATPSLVHTTTTTSLHANLSAGQFEFFVRALFNGCDPIDSAHALFTFAPPSGCPTQPPILIIPFDDSQLVSPVDFSAGAVPGATQYKLFLDETPVATSATPNFNGIAVPVGAHQWSVEASSATCPPLRSTENVFVAVAAPPPCSDPAIPELRADATASTGVTYVIHLSPLPNAQYELQEATGAAFADAVSTTSPAPAFARSHVNAGTAPVPYYYRARSINACNGNRSQFSDPIVVQVLPPQTTDPNEINGSTPANNPQPTHYIIHVGGNGASAVAAADGTPFTATTNVPWLTVTPSSGVVPAGGIDLKVTADSQGLPVGTSTGAVDVNLGVAGSSHGGVRPLDGPTTSTTTVSVNLVQPISGTPKGAPPPDALIIPAVAHAAGVNSQFQSDVRLTNTAAQAVKYQITFTPSGDEGNTTGQQTTLSVDPGRTIALDDVLNTWFGEQSATGTIEVRPLTATAATTSSKAVTGLAALTTFAASRTFNNTATGTFGQYIPAIPFANFVGRNLSDPSKSVILSLQQVAQSPDSRTNLGLVEGSGQPVTAQIAVYASSGAKLTEFTQNLAGGQHLQLNSFMSAKGLSVSDGRIEVKVVGGSGKVTAYASVLNNQTGDPLLVSPVAVTATGASKYVLPGVADLNNGFANWQTDVRVYNAGTSAVNATATFYPQNGESKSAPLSIAPGEVKVLDGVLLNLFGLTNTGGALHISTSTNTSLSASARTYNLTSNGVYGQFIGAVTANDTAALGTRALQLLQVEESNRYRTNVAIAETGGKSAKVEISIIPPDAKTIASTVVDLAPNQFIQFNQLLKGAGLGDDVYNARVTLRVIEGQGRITGYASVIDVLSGDPTFVPAQ